MTNFTQPIIASSPSWFHGEIHEAEKRLRASVDQFPEFKCYLRSEVYKPNYNGQRDYVAIALTGKRGYLRTRLSKSNGHHWPILYNDKYLLSYDIEMVLYHELAHFIVDEIRPNGSPHGIEWALVCDSLHMITGMDCITALEGSTWINEVSNNERAEVFKQYRISSFKEWKLSLERYREQFYIMLNEELQKLTYDRLISILSNCLFKNRTHNFL
jgi:hypothetical protein